ncbi:MAG: plasmid mobilization protein [Gemmatimonadaceae bacterium]
MATKTQHLQIRVTPGQKAALHRQAAAAGSDLSTYVLARLAPARHNRFAELLAALAAAEHRFALAELNDFLTDCPPILFHDAVAVAPITALVPYLQNYVAALVEHAAALKGVSPPGWTANVRPLKEPHFITPMASLRLHLLRSSPVPFKRRNIFVDSAIGARV